jgi:hypothetical protein
MLVTASARSHIERERQEQAEGRTESCTMDDFLVAGQMDIHRISRAGRILTRLEATVPSTVRVTVACPLRALPARCLLRMERRHSEALEKRLIDKRTPVSGRTFGPYLLEGIWNSNECRPNSISSKNTEFTVLRLSQNVCRKSPEGTSTHLRIDILRTSFDFAGGKVLAQTLRSHLPTYFKEI